MDAKRWKEISGFILGIILIANIFLHIRELKLKNNRKETLVKIIGTTFNQSSLLLTPSLLPMTSMPRSSTSFYSIPEVTPADIDKNQNLSRNMKLNQHSIIQHDSPCQVLKSTREPNDGRWFNFSSSQIVFYVYSAFVDDRPSLQRDSVVRIISITERIETITRPPPMFCRYLYLVDDGGVVLELRPSSETESKYRNGNAFEVAIDVEVERNPDRRIGIGWELNSKKVREYIFTCSLPTIDELRRRGFSSHRGINVYKLVSSTRLPLPRALSILAGQSGHQNVTACMPVEIPPKPRNKKNIVLCVKVAFGRIDPVRLVEWLELQIILGVGSIGIYDLNVHEPAMVVLRHYAKLGVVDLRKSDYIPSGPQQYPLHESPVINDCMYRNLYSTRYVAVYDIDEVILPKIETLDRVPLEQLLEKLKKRYGEDTKQYLFRNVYFFLDLPADSNESKEWTFLRYKHSVPKSNFGYSAKSIVDQDTCIQMHNHYCWGNTHAHENLTRIDVDSSIGQLQHYKKCHFDNKTCTAMIGKFEKDERILVYREELVKRVKARVGEIRTKIKNFGIADPFNGCFKEN